MKLDNIYIKPYNEVMGNYDKDTLMKNMVFEKGYELIVDNLIATDRRLYYANELLDILKKRIDKAIEYTNELIADTKGMLNDMKYQDKEETITRFVEDLEKDIKNYEHQISILRGKDNEI